MNEDLHIEKAAHLADKPGAENLATGRAKKFVADALAARETKGTHKTIIPRPIYAWGGVAIALAACVAIAVILFRPTMGGIPGMLIEHQDIHADTAVTDTTILETSDTLMIESIIWPD